MAIKPGDDVASAIIKIHDSLTHEDFVPKPDGNAKVILWDDGDGKGPYIKEWNTDLAKPTPEEIEAQL